MKTTVEIEWDEPKEQSWLCADNIAIALHAYCPNTKFIVREVLTGEEIEELMGLVHSGHRASQAAAQSEEK